MKKTYLMIVIILCMYRLSQAEWNKYSTSLPVQDDWNTFFIDTLQGWLFGSKYDTIPYLAESNNGGRSWTEQMVDSRLAYIRDLYFINTNIGWMVGESKQSYADSLGLIYKTENGGSSWHLVLEGKDIFRPRKIVFSTKEIGYVFSSSCLGRGYGEKGYGAILRTKDGGQNWLRDSLDNFNRYFLNAHFINTDTGWAVGGNYWEGDTAGFIMKTVNGGETWNFKSATEIISASELRSVFFVNGNNGWIGGRLRVNYSSNGILAYTEDGGDTWVIQKDTTSLDFNDEYRINKIHFFNDSIGWVIGLVGLHYTENGGMDWETTFLPNRDNIANAFFFNTNYAWLIGLTYDSKVVFYRTTDNGGHPQNTSIKHSLRQKTQLSQLFNIKISSAPKGMTNIHYRLDKDISLSLSVYNLKGVNVVSQPPISLKKGEHKFSVRIPKGLYVIETKTDNGSKETKFTQKILAR